MAIFPAWTFYLGMQYERTLKALTPVVNVSPPENIKHVSYTCDKSRSIMATYYIPADKSYGKVKVAIGTSAPITLNQTISASGIRYANSDESLVFWSKGNTALVMRDNQMDLNYTNCTEISE